LLFQEKNDQFQDDLYPPTFSGEPTMDADAWCKGTNGVPKTCSLAPGFVPPKTKDSSFIVQEVKPQKEKSLPELKEEHEKLSKRVAYLEAEIAKKDARIKELSG